MRNCLFLLLIILSCGVKQPIDVDIVTEHGHIFVESGQLSANIFLDNQNVNKTTPDTLKRVSVGTHVIKVIKSGFRSQPDSAVVSVRKDQTTPVSFKLQPLVSTGFVFIETIPNRGEIYLDNQPTGKMTPDTIQAAPGQHRIKIVKNGYSDLNWDVEVNLNSVEKLVGEFNIRHRVLLETFGNVSCTPCVEATANLHQFETEKDDSTYALIEYYANWPSPNDPFYQVSPNDVMQRLMFYNVTTLPTLMLDGTRGVDAADYASIVQNFNEIQTRHTEKMGLSVEKSLVNDSLKVFVQVYHFEKNLDNPDLRLFVAIIENEIHFTNPPGTNGLKDFDFVFRKFLSANTGDEFSSTGPIAEKRYSLAWPAWNYANCEVVAFIQLAGSHQTIQTTIH